MQVLGVPLPAFSAKKHFFLTSFQLNSEIFRYLATVSGRSSCYHSTTDDVSAPYICRVTLLCLQLLDKLLRVVSRVAAISLERNKIMFIFSKILVDQDS